MITRNGLNLEFITLVLNEVKDKNSVISEFGDFTCDVKFLSIFREYDSCCHYFLVSLDKKRILSSRGFCFQIVQLIIQNLSEQNDDHPDILGRDN